MPTVRRSCVNLFTQIGAPHQADGPGGGRGSVPEDLPVILLGFILDFTVRFRPPLLTNVFIRLAPQNYVFGCFSDGVNNLSSRGLTPQNGKPGFPNGIFLLFRKKKNSSKKNKKEKQNIFPIFPIFPVFLFWIFLVFLNTYSPNPISIGFKDRINRRSSR